MAQARAQGRERRDGGKLLRTPWGSLRGQAYLRGLEIPERWTPRDAYIQYLIENDNTRRYDELNAIIDAIIVTLPLEDRKSVLESINDRTKKILGAFFPHLKKSVDKTTSKSRDEQGFNVLANIYKAMGLDIPNGNPNPPNQPTL